MTGPILIAGDGVRATIGRRGAELLSLQDGEGREWIWDRDPAFWDRCAPVLFPIVGRAAHDAIIHAGRTYPMPQHGFAPEAEFELVAADARSCVLRIEATPSTRVIYPFEFRLDVAFRFQDGALHQTATVTNPGETELPASLGFHPAFVWPSADRMRHVVRFEHPEPGPIRRIVAGRLAPAVDERPVRDGVLALDDRLFEAGALVLDNPASRAVWFGVPGEAGVAVDFPDMPHLGIWTRPGAGFLCIEPWQGHHAPQDFEGEFLDMPGVIRIAPGEAAVRHMILRCGVR